jgi:predicted fused transcriptional regulator/phosphomethylpyrimidine kinase
MVEEVYFVNADDTTLLKKAIAKRLYTKNIDQSKISKILNLSQPMVSNYCSEVNKIPKNILNIAEKISEKIIDGTSSTFHTCISFNKKTIEGRFYIANKNEIISDENVKIVDNLTNAFLLLKDQNLSGLLPEVKVNIAMTKDKAESREDVASFLNGLIIADEKVTGSNGIRFGKSKHLSSVLLYIKDNLDVNAIMNIAYSERIKKSSFHYSSLTKDFKLKDNKKNIDILLHEGDFGIEPCAYILGNDAVDVANKIIKIKEEIK